MSEITQERQAAAVETETMKAAVVRSFEEPLRIEQVAEGPVAGPGGDRRADRGAGLCHTDIHAAHGDWPVKPAPPFIPGHEGVGLVEERGPGVTRWTSVIGSAIPWLGYACGTLRLLRLRVGDPLRAAAEHRLLASTAGSPSTSRADAHYVVQVPDGIDPARRHRSRAPA